MAPEGEEPVVVEREPVVEREAVAKCEAVVECKPIVEREAARVRCERAKMARPASGEMAAHAATKTPTHATPHLSRCVSGGKGRSA